MDSQYIQSELERLKEEFDSGEATTVGGAIQIIEHLRDELAKARKALKGAEDAKWSSFMAGLGPSRWE